MDLYELDDLEMASGGMSMWGMSIDRNRRSYVSSQVSATDKAAVSMSRYSMQTSIATADLDEIINQVRYVARQQRGVAMISQYNNNKPCFVYNIRSITSPAPSAYLTIPSTT